MFGIASVVADDVPHIDAMNNQPEVMDLQALAAAWRYESTRISFISVL